MKNALAPAEQAILESAVVREVQHIIDLYGLSIHRQNTGAVKIQKRFVKFGEEGDADYGGWCKYTGRHVEIECKRPVGGRLSQAQKRRLDAINKAGGVGIVVTSGMDCLAQLKEAGIIR